MIQRIIILILSFSLLPVFQADAAFMMLLHEKMKLQRKINRLLVKELLYTEAINAERYDSIFADCPRYAMIIANGSYGGKENLLTANNDADAVSDILQEIGFQTLVLKDGTKQDTKDFIRKTERIQKNAIIILYYTGYSISNSDKNYIIPIGANISTSADIEEECVSVDWIINKMADASPKAKITIFDANYENSLGVKSRGNTSSTLVSLKNIPEDSYIVYSQQPGITVKKSSSKNSIFALSLVEALSYPKLQLGDLFMICGDIVKKQTSNIQMPVIESDAIAAEYCRLNNTKTTIDSPKDTSTLHLKIMEEMRASLENHLTKKKEELEISSYASKYALIIGNATYQNASLINAINDAEDIAAQLRMLGFVVSEIHNVSNKHEFQQVVQNYRNSLAAGSLSLIYYAGHGIQASKSHENFLVPTDAVISSEADIFEECISLNSILSEFSNKNLYGNIIMLDACRNSPFRSYYRGGSTKGLAEQQCPLGTCIVYSTAANEVAADGTGRNSPFAESMIKALLSKDLSLTTMIKFVKANVFKITGDQRPWMSSTISKNCFLGNNDAFTSYFKTYNKVKDANLDNDYSESVSEKASVEQQLKLAKEELDAIEELGQSAKDVAPKFGLQ